MRGKITPHYENCCGVKDPVIDLDNSSEETENRNITQ